LILSRASSGAISGFARAPEYPTRLSASIRNLSGFVCSAWASSRARAS
jgi:hypothetical protein